MTFSKSHVLFTKVLGLGALWHVREAVESSGWSCVDMEGRIRDEVRDYIVGGQGHGRDRITAVRASVTIAVLALSLRGMTPGQARNV